MKITLTFDNGPDPAGTPVVLEALAKNEVPAIFFVLGSQVADPALCCLAEQVRDAGHLIGNHTYTHKQALGMMDDQDAAVEEIRQTESLIAHLTKGKLFRPVGNGGQLGPHMFSARTWDYLGEQGYDCILWNSLARDWEREENWVTPTLADVSERDWSVVVLHDILPGAMRHLDLFLKALKDRGAVFAQDFPEDCIAMKRGKATPMGLTYRRDVPA